MHYVSGLSSEESDALIATLSQMERKITGKVPAPLRVPSARARDTPAKGEIRGTIASTSGNLRQFSKPAPQE